MMMLKCANCGAPNPRRLSQCYNCAAELALPTAACSRCGQPVAAGAKVCSDCRAAAKRRFWGYVLMIFLPSIACSLPGFLMALVTVARRLDAIEKADRSRQQT
jgi:hypothetical protein